MSNTTGRCIPPDNMRIAIIGANGQLGTDLCRELKGRDVIPLTHSDIEISDMTSVKGELRKWQPDVIINTAAFVRVDDCEANSDRAYLVNALGARNIAVAAQEQGSKLIHISTDYVFGGEAEYHTMPYTEFDIPIPINTYGKSKLAGEKMVQYFCNRHFIIRSSGLFGIAGSSGKGGNFVETIVWMAKERRELTVVDDQVFSPTYTKDLARKIAQLINTEYYGIFHITNKGSCSWFNFTKEIIRLTGIEVNVIPVTSKEYPTPAKRPHFSVLDNFHLRLLGMDDIEPWQDALRDYLADKGYLQC